jgi:hypothetical protein
MASDMTTFEGQITKHSGAAVCFQGQFWETGVWLPRSQIVVEDDEEEGVVVKVKDWLARKNGLLEFTHYSAAELEAMNGQ